MDLPSRKHIRIPNYDYSNYGAYFITICTKDRKEILSQISVGANIVRPNTILTDIGKIVDEAIKNIHNHYNAVFVDNYVIMPDHIHLLLRIENSQDGRTMFAPTIDRVIKQTKGYISKQIGFPIWQKSFYDHIIRNEEDYNEIYQYITDNPLKYVLKKSENH